MPVFQRRQQLSGPNKAWSNSTKPRLQNSLQARLALEKAELGHEQQDKQRKIEDQAKALPDQRADDDCGARMFLEVISQRWPITCRKRKRLRRAAKWWRRVCKKKGGPVGGLSSQFLAQATLMHVADLVALCRGVQRATIYSNQHFQKHHELARNYLEARAEGCAPARASPSLSDPFSKVWPFSLTAMRLRVLSLSVLSLFGKGSIQKKGKTTEKVELSLVRQSLFRTQRLSKPSQLITPASRFNNEAQTFRGSKKGVPTNELGSHSTKRFSAAKMGWRGMARFGSV